MNLLKCETVGRIISSLVADCWDATVSPVVIPLGCVALMAVVFLSQGVATPSEIPRCEIIELLNELLFCHLPDSECSVVNLGAEIHQCIPSSPASCYSDSGVCGSFRCKAGAELCSCDKFRELRVDSPMLRLLS